MEQNIKDTKLHYLLFITNHQSPKKKLNVLTYLFAHLLVQLDPKFH